MLKITRDENLVNIFFGYFIQLNAIITQVRGYLKGYENREKMHIVISDNNKGLFLTPFVL